MTPAISVLFKVAIFTLVSACFCRPSLYDGDEDLLAYYSEQEPSRRFYLPVEVSYDAILNALRAHSQPSRLSESAVEKRFSSNTEILGSFLPKVDDDAEMRGMKRKMFWQPLGYLPASVRAHNNPSGSTTNGNQGSSANVFRYG